MQNYKQIARIEKLKTHASDFDMAFKLIWGWIKEGNISMKEAKELTLKAYKMFDNHD